MTEHKTARVALLSIGDELLLGEITDTNMPWISQQLLLLGMTVIGSETVGDEIEDIVAAFQRAMARADVVIATGGLGPTADDLTMEALARATGVSLSHREEVMEQMAARLKRPVALFSESNRKQAMLPEGSIVLRNDWGTAPGVYFSVPQKYGKPKDIFLMPGVPREMHGLLAERILPILREKYPAPRFLSIKRLHAFALPESTIGERIKPLMQAGHNPNVGTRVAGGIVTVRLVASGESIEQAQTILAPHEATVREALREGLFGEDDDTLAGVTLQALLDRKKTIALAESCTGGMVAALLTEISGSSASLMEGAIVYSNESKMRTCNVKAETLAAHGAVSAQTAEELAIGMRARAGTDLALSVTGIAGPGGGSEKKPVGLVFFGIASAHGVRSFEKNYPGMDRQRVRERAASQALDLIRRAALDIL